MDKDEATPSKGTAESPVSRETMVEYLTGEGRLRTPLAESLYAEGLDTWEKLMEGDKEYFTSFKGVGPKTSGVLIELGERKRDEFTEREAVSGDVREFLGGIQRVTGTVIEAMVEAGYDSVGRIADSEPSALRNVKGVGPKLSETIHAEAVKYSSEYPDLKYGPLGEPEEAVPLLAESEENREGEIVEGEKEGILGRLVRAIKGFFSTRKEEKTEVKDEPSKEESHVPPPGGDVDREHISKEREETPSTGEDTAVTSPEAGGSGPEKAKEPAEEEPVRHAGIDPRAEEEEEGDGAIPAGEKEPEGVEAPEEETTGTAAEIGVPGEPEEPEEATGEKRGAGVFQRVRSFFSGRKGQLEGASPEKGEGQKEETPTLGEKEGGGILG